MFTRAIGINGSGEIVGYYYDAMLHAHGFLYAGGKFTAIDFPGAEEYLSLRNQQFRRNRGVL